MTGNSIVETIYYLQGFIAVFTLVLIILASLPLTKEVKVVITVLMLALTFVHYYILLVLMRFEKIMIYPLLVLEQRHGYSVASPDYGQILLLAALIVWRYELREKMRSIAAWLRKVLRSYWR